MASPSSVSTAKQYTHQRWGEICSNSVHSYKEVAVQSQTLSISLSDFFNTFLADDSPHCFGKFQRDTIKDTNIQITAWNESHEQDEHDNVMKRTISFLHQRKATLGPSSVSVEREQTYCHFPNNGIVLNNTIATKGVPYSDSFVAQEEWIISNSKDMTEQVIFSVRFRIHFITSPMSFIKKNIVGQCKKGLQDWFQQYMEMVHSVVNKRNSLEPVAVEGRMTRTRAEELHEQDYNDDHDRDHDYDDTPLHNEPWNDRSMDHIHTAITVASFLYDVSNMIASSR